MAFEATTTTTTTTTTKYITQMWAYPQLVCRDPPQYDRSTKQQRTDRRRSFLQVFHCSNHVYCGGGGGLFNTGCAVREFEIVEGMQASSTVLIFFPLYSHPLQLSEIGCIPPPTPIALPSITPCWQQTDTSSHSCGALNIALLQSAATR